MKNYGPWLLASDSGGIRSGAEYLPVAPASPWGHPASIRKWWRVRGGPLDGTLTMSNINEVGAAFVKHYYTLFDSDRSKLAPLYREGSMLSFEGEGFQGANNIVAKLTSLKFQRVNHNITTLDVQPSGANSLIIVVCGDLKVDDTPNPLKFSQTFHLIPTDPNMQDFWVHNDLFRLNYG